jgi:hypothetical protein
MLGAFGAHLDDDMAWGLPLRQVYGLGQASIGVFKANRCRQTALMSYERGSTRGWLIGMSEGYYIEGFRKRIGKPQNGSVKKQSIEDM